MNSLARFLIVVGCAALSACDSRSAREAKELARFPGGQIVIDLESPSTTPGRDFADSLRVTQPVIGRGVCVADHAAPVQGGFAAPRHGLWTYEYVTTTQKRSDAGDPITMFGPIDETAIGIEAQGEYVDDRPTGAWTFWYPDERPRASGAFESGRMSGEWRFWLPDGSVDRVHSGVYEHGALTSNTPK